MTNYGKVFMLWATGDFNGDLAVDINDLSRVLANYDKSTAASAAGIKAVPEPSAIVLLGVGAMSLAAFAWRKRG